MIDNLIFSRYNLSWSFYTNNIIKLLLLIECFEMEHTQNIQNPINVHPVVSHNYCKMTQLFEGQLFNSKIYIINLLISVVMQYRISLWKVTFCFFYFNAYFYFKNSKVIKTVISTIIVFNTLLCFLLKMGQKRD